MDGDQRLREFRAWIEAYVREEVEKQLEAAQVSPEAQPDSMAHWYAGGESEEVQEAAARAQANWFLGGSDAGVVADGFTAED